MTTIENDYSVLFIGDYFSLIIDVTTSSRDHDAIADQAIKFVEDYYGWTNLREVSKQITIRDSDGSELGEV